MVNKMLRKPAVSATTQRGLPSRFALSSGSGLGSVSGDPSGLVERIVEEEEEEEEEQVVVVVVVEILAR